MGKDGMLEIKFDREMQEGMKELRWSKQTERFRWKEEGCREVQNEMLQLKEGGRAEMSGLRKSQGWGTKWWSRDANRKCETGALMVSVGASCSWLVSFMASCYFCSFQFSLFSPWLSLPIIKTQAPYIYRWPRNECIPAACVCVCRSQGGGGLIDSRGGGMGRP